MRFLSVFFGFCALFAIFSGSALCQPISRELPRAGEISLRGQVISITAATNTLELEAVSFSLPNGKSSDLKIPKAKTILLNNSKLFDHDKVLSPDELKVGEKITATGTDAGGAVGFRARVIWREEQIENKQILPVEQAVAEKENVLPATELKHTDLLPPVYRGGDTTVSIVDFGFDYFARVAHYLPGNKGQPEFFAIFEMGRLKNGTQENIDPSLVSIRRIVSSSGQIIRNLPFFRPADNDPKHYWFHDSRIDPRWEYIDVDMDMKPQGSAVDDGKSSVSITLDSLPIPKVGQEIEINRQFKGGLGTTFTLLKVKLASNNKDVVLVWQHELDAATNDVIVESSSYKYGKVHSAMGLETKGNQPRAEHDLYLNYSTDLETNKFEFTVTESAPARVNRAGFRRIRFRLPISKTLQTRPVQVMPEVSLATIETIENEDLSVRAEYSDLNTTGTNGLLWVKTPAEDARRGLLWRPFEAKSIYSDFGIETKIPLYFPIWPTMEFYWHGDGTPVSANVSGTMFISRVPSTVATYDGAIKLEKRLIVENNFSVANIPVLPTGSAPKILQEWSENTLDLRKIVRYDSPKEIARFMNNGETPQSGLALVFQTSPYVPGAPFVSTVLDVEDNLGRSLRSNEDRHRPCFQGDLTSLAGDDEKFYTVFVAAPRDAQSVTLWMQTVETADPVKETTVKIHNVTNFCKDCPPTAGN